MRFSGHTGSEQFSRAVKSVRYIITTSYFLIKNLNCYLLVLFGSNDLFGAAWVTFLTPR